MLFGVTETLTSAGNQTLLANSLNKELSKLIFVISI
jgi:hypothetical protein